MIFRPQGRFLFCGSMRCEAAYAYIIPENIRTLIF